MHNIFKEAAKKNGGFIVAVGQGEGGSVCYVPSKASELLLRTAKYLYHVKLPNFQILPLEALLSCPQSLCERSPSIGPI